MTCAAFSIKFAKTNQKFAENSEFCEKIHYYSKLFTSLLRRCLTAGLLAAVQRVEVVAEGESGDVKLEIKSISVQGGGATSRVEETILI